MAFSIRTFFGKDKPAEDGKADPSAASESHQQHGPMNGTPNSPFSQSGGGNPFASGMLFKTANGMEAPGAPVGSPFAPAAASQSGEVPALTVGDVIAQLPPDVARNNQLPPNQPLQLSEEVVERALRSGQAALPLFEIYRVCPALFQTPISPQDPRIVPLPPQKIAHLIPNSGAAKQESHLPVEKQPVQPLPPTGGGMGASPFGQSPPWAQGSPFSVAPTTSSTGGSQASPPPAALPPGGAPLPGPGPSPFGSGASPFSSSPASTSNSNPFSPAPVVPPQTAPVNPFAPPAATSPPPVSSNPFSPAPQPEGSPFSFSMPGDSGASPFMSADANGALNPFKPADSLPGAASIPPPPPANALPDFFAQGNTESKSPFGLPTATPGVDPFAPVPKIPAAKPPEQNASSSPFGGSPFTMPGESSMPTMPTGALPPELPNKAASLFPSASSSAPAPTPSVQPSPGLVGGMNPFDRIQALGTTPSTPSSSVPTAPVESSMFKSAPAAENNLFKPAATSAPGLPEFKPASLPPAGAGFPPSASPTGEMISMGLATALKNCRPEDLGMSLDTVPLWVQVNFPAHLIRSKMAGGGPVQVTLDELRSGVAPEFRNLLGVAKPQLIITLPANELMQGLSGTSAPAPTATPESSPLKAPPFQSVDPFASLPPAQPHSFEPVKNEAPVFPPAPPAPAKDAAEGVWPFGMSFAESGFDEVPAPAPFDLLDVSSPAVAPGAPPAPKKPVEAPFFEPAPVKSNSIISKAPRTSGGDKHRRLLLRVLLGSPEDLDLNGMLRKICALPDVLAIVCLKGSSLHSSAGNGSAEANHFIKQSPLVHEHLRPLVSLTGADEFETFTIRGELHLVTFSIEPEVTLGVLHAPGDHETALREKITLLTPEIAAMVAAGE